MTSCVSSAEPARPPLNASSARLPASAKRSVAANGGHCLCLNTAEGLLQVVIARREPGVAAWRLLRAETRHAPSQGVELLTPVLASALADLGLAPGALDRIACVRGPGGFTGLRLALSTAAGLSRATGALCAGIDYLPLLAHSARRRLDGMPDAQHGHPDTPAPREGAERTLWVITHARSRLTHLQGFAVSAGQDCGERVPMPRPLTDIVALTPEEAALAIRARREASCDAGRSAAPPLVLGSGLSRHRAAFTAALQDNGARRATDAAGRQCAAPLLLPPDFDHPLPESLAEMAARLDYAPGDIEPLYARPPDAEDNLERIARSLGLDPEKARDKLTALTKNAP
jgi:tRNA threonylcarbamoyl adenosine modification protein YeaZ